MSAFAAVIGGGGKASFDTGLPMFDSQVMAGLAANPAMQGVTSLVGAGAASDLYSIKTAMQGRQFIYGIQVNAGYKVLDWLGVSFGVRMNYFNGGYKGYVNASLKPELLQNPKIQAVAQQNPALMQLASKGLYDLKLNVDQTGWGLAPIIGVDINYKKWNIGLKYEFMTNLNIENKTKENSDPDGALKDYKDGVNTPNDIPALLTAAVSYEFLPTLRATAEYHHFFDKQAGMAGGKQKKLERGTNEYLFGAEWDMIEKLTLSAGVQFTDYGLSDGFQTDTSFSCDSHSIGFGGKWKPTSRIGVDISYFWTTYKDYTKKSDNYNGTTLPGQNIYSRSNKVFGVAIDYAF